LETERTSFYCSSSSVSRSASGLSFAIFVSPGLHELLRSARHRAMTAPAAAPFAAVAATDDLSGRFKASMHVEEMSEREERVVSTLGRIGFLALAVVFAIIGWFLVKAAVQFDPYDAVSVGGALGRLPRLDYGKFRLGLVALRVRPLRLRPGALPEGVRPGMALGAARKFQRRAGSFRWEPGRQRPPGTM
jgi:hypothetical protein